MTNTSSPTHVGSASIARLVVTALCSGLLAVLWAPVAARVLVPVLQADGPFVAAHYTLSAGIAGMLSGMFAGRSRWVGLGAALLAGAVAAGVLAALGSMAWAGGVTLLVLCFLSGSAARWILSRLPSTLDELASARPALAIGWALLTLGCVFQVSRLSTFVCDQTDGFFLSTDDPTWAKHMCLPSYLYGAELSERGEENIYSSAHYPLWNPEVGLGSRFDFTEPDDSCIRRRSCFYPAPSSHCPMTSN